MHEYDPEENFADETPDKPGRSTGPRSPQGRSRSSMNRLTHGCRSELLILPFEDPAEFEFTAQSWTDSYNPQDPTAATLVYETAKAHWFFQRNQKRLHQIEIRLPSDAWLWTDENIRLFNNFSRYKTAAERSFYRAFNNLEAYYKRQADRAAQAEKARAQMAKIELDWLTKKQERAAEDMVAKQYIDVMGNSSDTTTTWLPTNDQIVAAAANTGKTPEFVNRYLFFWTGVPPEYEWTNPNHIQRAERTIGIQRLFYSEWLKLIEKEKATGHIQPRETVLATSPDPSVHSK
jgi:hypothetical protein